MVRWWWRQRTNTDTQRLGMRSAARGDGHCGEDKVSSQSRSFTFSPSSSHTLCPVTKSNKLGPSTCRLACLQSISHASLCIRGNYTQTANVSDATNLARRLQSFAVGALAFACFGSVQHHHQHHHHQFRPHCLPTCYLNLISKHTVRILQSTFRRGSEYL